MEEGRTHEEAEQLRQVIAALEEMGLRDKFKVIIGGAETTPEKAEAMGCDGQADNAVEAVSLCERLMGL